jgi:hypothetical protein
MLKVSRCQLCYKFYRTGKIRQIAEKVLDNERKLSLVSKTDKPKEISKFVNKRLLVCKDCYKRLEEGEGVTRGNNEGDFWDGNLLGEDSELSEKAVGSWNKEQRESVKNAFQDAVKPAGKKRGRKPKSTVESVTENAAQEAKEETDRSARDTLSESEQVIKQSPERKAFKERVKDILAQDSNILYSDIAARLNASELLVSEICDEIDKEGGK